MFSRAIWVRTLAAALLATGTISAQQTARTTAPGPDLYSRLHWRTIGPEGNRFSAAAGVPGDPYTYYVGAASGGIFKTSDGGINWTPIFDAQPVQSIGALGVEQSDPNIIWAGTGEGKIRSHISIGQGIYRSVDGGKTWTLMGLEQTARNSKVTDICGRHRSSVTSNAQPRSRLQTQYAPNNNTFRFSMFATTPNRESRHPTFFVSSHASRISRCSELIAFTRDGCDLTDLHLTLA